MLPDQPGSQKDHMGKRFVLMMILTAVLLACGLPIRYVDETRFTPTAPPQPTAAPPSIPASEPPFQPTPTPLPTLLPSRTPLPTRTPVPFLWLERPSSQVNILVLGSDERPGTGYRTDVILWLSLNPAHGTASLISFPRDLYVHIPGHDDNRINVAHAFGFETLADTFQTNFGVRPDHYIMTNFAGFTGIVDSLGGIDVEAATDLTDKCDLPQGEKGYCTIHAGLNHMDGQTALWYVRARYTTSDFNRARRSREVLIALFRAMLSIDAVAHAPTIYNQYRSSVETDLSLQDILSLAPLALELTQPDRLRLYNITTDEATPYTIPETGAQVLLPDTDAIMDMFYYALMP